MKELEDQINIFIEQAYECGRLGHDPFHLITLKDRSRRTIAKLLKEEQEAKRA